VVLVPGYGGRLPAVERWRMAVALRTLAVHGGGTLVASGYQGEAERLALLAPADKVVIEANSTNDSGQRGAVHSLLRGGRSVGDRIGLAPRSPGEQLLAAVAARSEQASRARRTAMVAWMVDSGRWHGLRVAAPGTKAGAVVQIGTKRGRRPGGRASRRVLCGSFLPGKVGARGVRFESEAWRAERTIERAHQENLENTLDNRDPFRQSRSTMAQFNAPLHSEFIRCRLLMPSRPLFG
jgi:hypothetical protein